MAFGLAVLALGLLPAALARSSSTTQPAAVSTAVVDGTTYTFRGMVAFGQIAADAVDSVGDTIGGIGSAIKMEPDSFQIAKDGTASGTLIMQPDRGHNAGGSATVDYAARSHQVDFTLIPYYGNGTAPKNSLDLSYQKSHRYRDTTLAKPSLTTGLDPTNIRPAQGFFTVEPAAVSNTTGANEYTFDLEGLTFAPDGTRWVSDEYGPYIYHIDTDGETLLSSLQPPKAIVPFAANGSYQFNTLVDGVETAPASGRVPNQGFEALTITPDGKTLYAALQSGTVQDGGSEATAGQLTRLLGWDISDPDSPKLVEEYVVQLPVNDKGKVLAQSEIQFVKPGVFLMLARDGKGLGNNGPASDVSSSDATSAFKNAGLVSINGATNIAGQFDGINQTFLGSQFTFANFTPFVSFIIDDQLSKFGLHNGLPLTNDIVGKFESLALVSCGDKANPDDYFLFSAADNDFITTDGVQSQPKGSTYSDPYGMDVPNQVFVFRVTLPGAAVGT